MYVVISTIDKVSTRRSEGGGEDRVASGDREPSEALVTDVVDGEAG